ncbi:DUF6455 family protein [uncultured Ferrovibrio sp.]|jgi:hypothetical protein|uniref:DUF6455 family protein n=1 Tax=uncultured Ferrovibrio sp. TaxID=1576913 RepID=UPI0026046217|nr:DUF6455 family protein [uncultured Ferrovibrio sp.]
MLPSLIKSLEQRSALMQQMIQRLDVDLEASATVALGTQLSRAARTCAYCRSVAACQTWFAGGARGDAYRQFCPNAARFDSLPHKSKAA